MDRVLEELVHVEARQPRGLGLLGLELSNLSSFGRLLAGQRFLVLYLDNLLDQIEVLG